MRVAALLAALAAAALLPYAPLGVGMVIVAVLVAVAAAWTLRPTVDNVVFGSLALALASLPAVLDADWVLTLALAAAWLLASAAVAGPTVAAVLAPIARLRDAPALTPQSAAGLAPAFRGVVFGGLLTLPFGLLFWNADAAFAQLLDSVPLPSTDTLPGRIAVFALVLAAALGLALASRRPLRQRSLEVRRKLGRWEWIVPLALLDALFLVFVLVQVTVLFGGNDHVLRTAGLTYAEYARSGFWQLLAVAALTLVVVGVAVVVAHAPDRRDRLVLRALLGVLCVLTIVILFSTLHRLELYEQAFGLTRLRLSVEVFTVWIGALFALVIAAGAIARVRRHLLRAVLAGTGAAWLAFSLANPDAMIAERNLERWRETGKLDVSYLQTLSADAAPQLVELPVDLRRRALRCLAGDLAGGEPWSSANLSRHRARTLLAENEVRPL